MSSVNDQITDAVSQMNALLTGGAPSQAMGMLDVTGTETVGMGMFNAITAQQNAQTSASAAATASCAKMLRTEITKPDSLDSSSKLELELALLKAELAEQGIVKNMALATINELIDNASINQEKLKHASSSAMNTVKEMLSSAELSLFKSAQKTFEQDAGDSPSQTSS